MSVWNRLFDRSQSSRSVSAPAAGGRLCVEALETREVMSAVTPDVWTPMDGRHPLDVGATTAQSRPTPPALTSAPADPVAASDHLLTLDAPKGESKDGAPKETIVVASWSLGGSNGGIWR